MAIFAPLITTHLGVKKVPIRYTIQGKNRSAEIPGIMQMTVEPAADACIRAAKCGPTRASGRARPAGAGGRAATAAPSPITACAGTIPGATGITPRSAGRTDDRASTWFRERDRAALPPPRDRRSRDPPLCRRDRRAGRLGQGHAGAPARRALRAGASRYRQALPRDRFSRARSRRRPGRSRGGARRGAARRSRHPRRPAAARRECRRRRLGRRRDPGGPRRAARVPARFRGQPPAAIARGGAQWRDTRRPRYRHGRVPRRGREAVHNRQPRGAGRTAGAGVAGARRCRYIRRCPAGHEGTRRARQLASGRTARGSPRRRND